MVFNSLVWGPLQERRVTLFFSLCVCADDSVKPPWPLVFCDVRTNSHQRGPPTGAGLRAPAFGTQHISRKMTKGWRRESCPFPWLFVSVDELPSWQPRQKDYGLCDSSKKPPCVKATGTHAFFRPLTSKIEKFVSAVSFSPCCPNFNFVRFLPTAWCFAAEVTIKPRVGSRGRSRRFFCGTGCFLSPVDSQYIADKPIRTIRCENEKEYSRTSTFVLDQLCYHVAHHHQRLMFRRGLTSLPPSRGSRPAAVCRVIVWSAARTTSKV